MAKIRKRDNSYQIDYFDPDGKRIRKSFQKRKDAEAELGKRVSLIAEGRYLDVKKDYKTTLGELLDKYVENYKDQGAFSSKECFIRNFREYFGNNALLVNIRYVDVETYRNHIRRKITRYGTKRKDGSVNREISCLHHILKKAVNWEMIQENPFDKGDPPWLKENNRRYRYLSEDEIERLLQEAVRPWLEDLLTVAIFTGMRRNELFGLKWEQIRGDFIYLSKTKTNESRQIPILQDDEGIDLKDVLADIRQRNQLKSEYVFIDKKGQGINKDRLFYALNASLKRAGIEDFQFRDLRHTFASHFVMNGGSLKALQEILGHKNITMTMRYAHLSKEHKKDEIKALRGLIKHQSSKTVTKLPHLRKKAI